MTAFIRQHHANLIEAEAIPNLFRDKVLSFED